MLYSYIFTITALIFALHFYKNRYPKEFDTLLEQFLENIQDSETIKPFLPFLTMMCYNIIYVYSFCQVTLNKTIKFAIPYIQNLSKFVRNKVEGNFLCKTNQYNLVIDWSGFCIIKSEIKGDMIILDKVPDSLDNIQYEISNMRFMGLYFKFKIGNEEIERVINLYSLYMNFYVVGNVLNSDFFKFYLQNLLKVNLDKNLPFVYTLEIMDHNLSIIILNETQSIVIKKDGYEILGTKKMVVSVSDVLNEINTSTSEVEVEIETEKEIKGEVEIKDELTESKKTLDNAFEPSTVIY